MERADRTPGTSRRQFLRGLGAAGLVTATAGLAAACGSRATPAPGAPGQAGLASGDMRVWISGGPELETAMRKILDEFGADKPNLRLILENFPFNQYYQKLATAFAGDTGPDLFWIDVRTAEFASRGAMLPIDQYVTEEWTADVFPVALQEGFWNGKRYAVPMHELANGLYVNKVLFDGAGIPIPHEVGDAWTWDQLRENARRLVERSGAATTRWGFATQRDPGDWTVLPFLQQNGGQALSPDLKRASGYLDSPASVEALTWYGGLYNEDRVASAGLPPDPLPTGRVAIFDAVSTYVIPLRGRYASFEYDVAPAPRNRQSAVMTGGFNVGIGSDTTNPDLAWSLVDFMARVKHAQWALESGYLPARRSTVAANPMYREHPWKLFMDQLEQAGIHRPPTAEYSFFADVFGDMARDITTGANVRQAVAKATAALDQRLGSK